MSACDPGRATELDGLPVVIGSGLAGLMTAWALAPEPCVLVSAGPLGVGTASGWAQGGLAAAIDPQDDPALHAADTLAAGAHLGDPAAVRRITGAAPSVVELLVALGVPFDRRADGSLVLGLEGGHGRHRIVHVDGDRTGAGITRTLVQVVSRLPSVTLLEHTRATGVEVDDAGSVTGVSLTSTAGTQRIRTRRVVLATGGAAAIFAHTTNPLGSHGHGLALAARAGAALADLEFVQFHPTALDVGRDPMPLLTEALRGAGGRLLADGERFVDELEPRDVVATAVWEQLRRRRPVALDVRSVPRLPERFPGLMTVCAELGLDPRQGVLPVRPAAHYHMGGVLTDARGRTDVPGLWAAGEVACTGLHGANRLASNSLLEAAATGQAVARDLASEPGAGDLSWCPPERASRLPVVPEPQGRAPSLEAVRALLSAHVGVLRDEDGLGTAARALEPHLHDDHALVAWLITDAARRRRTSCGGHRRSDEAAAPARHPAAEGAFA
ncbi:MAG TPA: L-aspartate oxidase [Segeticoccus sp.]|uniref:L-aspartate oxidase n=1 Tax=Segeticoccus sp. TaxID=2706531 RepID=UPI002D804020|nr:L-aspartate oxidase [Segeticoccus sp.]HET8599580.1 L-aspartate oxidase [Segeticoccus sp.]